MKLPGWVSDGSIQIVADSQMSLVCVVTNTSNNVIGFPCQRGENRMATNFENLIGCRIPTQTSLHNVKMC
jgi:hypothetical protein